MSIPKRHFSLCSSAGSGRSPLRVSAGPAGTRVARYTLRVNGWAMAPLAPWLVTAAVGGRLHVTRNVFVGASAPALILNINSFLLGQIWNTLCSAIAFLDLKVFQICLFIFFDRKKSQIWNTFAIRTSSTCMSIIPKKSNLEHFIMIDNLAR
jgi:hypothetical protein